MGSAAGLDAKLFRVRELLTIEDPDDPVLRETARLISAYWREALGPTEPQFPVAELVCRLSEAGGRRWGRLFTVHESGTLVGAALQSIAGEQGRGSFLRWAMVAPDARRRGVGRALFEMATERALIEGRVHIDWNTAVDNTAAAAFSEALGGRAQQVIEQSRVATSAMDSTMLRAWVEMARGRATDYDLVGWDGPCPEGHLEGFARLRGVMDAAPGNRPEDAMPWSAGRVREVEAFDLLRGPCWVLCARHRPTGLLVGYTELQPLSSRPWLASQGDTGVEPAHRGYGLGRWLKAVNALRLLDEMPEVRVIETWNAESNDPMLAINRPMGFVPVCRWQGWSLAI